MFILVYVMFLNLFSVMKHVEWKASHYFLMYGYLLMHCLYNTLWFSGIDEYISIHRRPWIPLRKAFIFCIFQFEMCYLFLCSVCNFYSSNSFISRNIFHFVFCDLIAIKFMNSVALIKLYFIIYFRQKMKRIDLMFMYKLTNCF